MENKSLRVSDVTFDKGSHTYMLYGNVLKGVTPIVKWMFPDTYLSIPDEVLKKAADYGGLIHSKLELYDATGIADNECKPLMDYIKLKEKFGIRVHMSEYLVDDGQNIASSIDKVFAPDTDGRWSLADVKTTSSIHVNNVRLQLSIYAYLFELCNPGQEAGKLYVIWLPKPQYGSADMIEVERIPADTCKDIIRAYLNGEDSSRFKDLWNIGTVKKEGAEEEIPERYAEVVQELAEILKTEKEMAARKDELKEFLMNEMSSLGVRKWVDASLQITKKAASVRQSVDSKKLKDEHPEIYAECLKNVNVKESIEIKLK